MTGVWACRKPDGKFVSHDGWSAEREDNLGFGTIAIREGDEVVAMVMTTRLDAISAPDGGALGRRADFIVAACNAAFNAAAAQPATVPQALIDSLSLLADDVDRVLKLDERESIEAAIELLAKLPRRTA